MSKLSTVLRQWCPDCQKITVTWMDGIGQSRCSKCDPVSVEHPGYGIRDFPEDGD